jgi:hypothetical protein
VSRTLCATRKNMVCVCIQNANAQLFKGCQHLGRVWIDRQSASGCGKTSRSRKSFIRQLSRERSGKLGLKRCSGRRDPRTLGCQSDRSRRKPEEAFAHLRLALIDFPTARLITAGVLIETNHRLLARERRRVGSWLREQSVAELVMESTARYRIIPIMCPRPQE